MLKKKSVLNSTLDELIEEEKKEPTQSEEHLDLMNEYSSGSVEENEDILSLLEFTPGKTNEKTVQKSAVQENPAKLEKTQSKPSSSSALEQSLPVHVQLEQSKYLSKAEEKITHLEQEIERLQQENEELGSCGKGLSDEMDKAKIRYENLKKLYEDSLEDFKNERRIFMDTSEEQKKQIEKITQENEGLKKRLTGDFKNIRVRERELENRLELVQMDKQTLLRKKDENILHLKRETGKLKHQMNQYKNQQNEVLQKFKNQENRLRGAVKGLQIVLNNIKGRTAPSKTLAEQESLVQKAKEES